MFSDSRIVQSLSVYERPSEGTEDSAVYVEGWLQHSTGRKRNRRDVLRRAEAKNMLQVCFVSTGDL